MAIKAYTLEFRFFGVTTESRELTVKNNLYDVGVGECTYGANIDLEYSTLHNYVSIPVKAGSRFQVLDVDLNSSGFIDYANACTTIDFQSVEVVFVKELALLENRGKVNDSNLMKVWERVR